MEMTSVPKMKPLFLTFKVIDNVNVDNRQTGKQRGQNMFRDMNRYLYLGIFTQLRWIL